MKKVSGFYIALILFLSVCILMIVLVFGQGFDLLICNDVQNTIEQLNQTCLLKYGWGGEINLYAHAQMALNTFYLDN